MLFLILVVLFLGFFIIWKKKQAQDPKYFFLRENIKGEINKSSGVSTSFWNWQSPLSFKFRKHSIDFETSHTLSWPQYNSSLMFFSLSVLLFFQGCSLNLCLSYRLFAPVFPFLFFYYHVGGNIFVPPFLSVSCYLLQLLLADFFFHYLVFSFSHSTVTHNFFLLKLLSTFTLLCSPSRSPPHIFMFSLTHSLLSLASLQS